MESKVSVIIPTYKRSEFLERAIDSVLNQSYSNIEVIIVDDNDPSSNYRYDTEKKMLRYQENSKVKYTKNNNNLGGALSRNEGIFKASGDFITFLDDDDIYLPDKIKVQVDYMIKNDFDMTLTNLKLVNEKDVLIGYRKYNHIEELDRDKLLKYHLMRHLTGTPTFMYKANKLKEIQGFENVKMGQEFFLMLKSIENNLKIGYLNECYVIAYRHNSGGISQGKNKIIGENNIYSLKKGYFNTFTMREKMFIRFRHYAVMTIAYIRNKDFINALLNSIKMICSSPLDFIMETFKYIFSIFSIFRNTRIKDSHNNFN